MINVTKIANETDGFLLNYYVGGENKILLVNGKNIVESLNVANEEVKKWRTEQQDKESALRSQYAEKSCAQGRVGGLADYSNASDVVRAA